MNEMIKVSASEFGKEVGRYQDVALTQPVFVTRNGRERTVMISVEEYRRLKRRDRRVLGPEDFTAEEVEAIKNAKAPPEAAAFDHELDQ